MSDNTPPLEKQIELLQNFFPDACDKDGKFNIEAALQKLHDPVERYRNRYRGKSTYSLFKALLLRILSMLSAKIHPLSNKEKEEEQVIRSEKLNTLNGFVLSTDPKKGLSADPPLSQIQVNNLMKYAGTSTRGNEKEKIKINGKIYFVSPQDILGVVTDGKVIPYGKCQRNLDYGAQLIFQSIRDDQGNEYMFSNLVEMMNEYTAALKEPAPQSEKPQADKTEVAEVTEVAQAVSSNDNPPKNPPDNPPDDDPPDDDPPRNPPKDGTKPEDPQDVKPDDNVVTKTETDPNSSHDNVSDNDPPKDGTKPDDIQDMKPDNGVVTKAEADPNNPDDSIFSGVRGRNSDSHVITKAEADPNNPDESIFSGVRGRSSDFLSKIRQQTGFDDGPIDSGVRGKTNPLVALETKGSTPFDPDTKKDVMGSPDSMKLLALAREQTENPSGFIFRQKCKETQQDTQEQPQDNSIFGLRN